MDEMQFLGYLIGAIITLGAFVAVVMKIVQPINELRIVIQKLNDMIDSMKTNDEKRDKRLDKHENRLDDLDHRVDKVETKMKIYHENGAAK